MGLPPHQWQSEWQRRLPRALLLMGLAMGTVHAAAVTDLDDPIMDWHLRLSVHARPLSAILDQLALTTGLDVEIDPRLNSLDQRVDLQADGVPLGTILEWIGDCSAVRCRVEGTKLIVAPAEPSRRMAQAERRF